jgi:hypothetical protein
MSCLLDPFSIVMWSRAVRALQLILLQCRPPPAPVILPPGLALPHPSDIMGGICLPPHPPDVQVQHPLLPLPFVMGGGGNLSNYTASKWGASSANVTLSWLVNTARSSNCLPGSINPPSRTGSGLNHSPPASHDHGFSMAVASHSHHKGRPHSSAW